MKILTTKIDDVLIIEPDVFSDHRGFFMETYQKHRYWKSGITTDFVQDNLSFSVSGTLRGLHFQNPSAQAKLIHVIQGAVFDVAVDIRNGSPTFGQWVSTILSEENKRQFLVPQGFAHGFCVISQTALFTYKCSDFYAPQYEHGILWNDPDIGIKWPVDNPVLSDKDKQFPRLKDIPDDQLPKL